jgi:pyroglutamyl-peptidase
MERPLLVTAFEPFANATINPSEAGVRALERGRHASRIRVLVLPVTYDGAAALLAERMRTENPVGVLSFGLSRDATGLVVESSAYNLRDASAPDNAGVIRTGVPVIAKAPERFEAGAIADRVARSLEAKSVPVLRSTDPGRYVCNSTYYAALFHARGRPVLFVHVPATTPIGGAVEPGTLETWMELAVESMLEASTASSG